jgi:hypothetical protein|tara:strand:- start:11030 stop:11350 length:321 start_codon:yes stop_codon:yes gene_type:complete
MNRYSNVKEIRNTNEFVGTIGTKYYTNNTYPEVPPNENDIWVETEFGDRLDSLAFQFYNDVTLYWVISIANPNKINMGSLFLDPGAQIRIPTNIVQIVDSYNILNR